MSKAQSGTGATRSLKSEHGEDQPFDAGSWLAQGSINAKEDIETKARTLFFGEPEAKRVYFPKGRMVFNMCLR